MQVHVRHGLPRRRSIVDADIEAIGAKLCDEPSASASKQPQQIALLLGVQVEEGANVSYWDHKRVTGTDRERIANDDGTFALIHDPVIRQRAERAGSVHRT